MDLDVYPKSRFKSFGFIRPSVFLMLISMFFSASIYYHIVFIFDAFIPHTLYKRFYISE